MLALVTGGCGAGAPSATANDVGAAYDSGAAGDADAAGAVGPLRVLNYNVMCSFCKFDDARDYDNDWATRVPWLRDVLTRHDADIVGVQELQALTLAEGDPQEFTEILPAGYDLDWYREQPGDPLPGGYPDAAIAWRASRFAKVDQGWFWLSPTPDVAYSSGFAKGGQFPRIVFWVELVEQASGRHLVVANTHFDNNPPSQEKSAPLLLARLAPLSARGPLVVLGDFNTRPGHAAYESLVAGTPLLLDTFGAVHATKGKDAIVLSNVTPPPLWDESDRIDHVFVHSPAGATGLTPTAWRVDLFRYGPKQQPPSDHPGAVVVDLQWGGAGPGGG